MFVWPQPLKAFGCGELCLGPYAIAVASCGAWAKAFRLPGSRRHWPMSCWRSFGNTRCRLDSGLMLSLFRAPV